MSTWLAVGIGGALGSMARHGVNRLVHSQWPFAQFPWATLVVNVVGCLVIGVLAGLVATGRLPMRFYWREFVFVGVLGGFTTFSTFGLDTITLVREGEGLKATWNVASQVVVGLLAVSAGLSVVEIFATKVR